MENLSLSFVPVTAERWFDFEQLLGGGQECHGCYCMWLRTADQEAFQARMGNGNREAMHALIEGGTVPGLLAMANGMAVGWLAIGPRSDFVALDQFPEFATTDLPSGELWACPCFYIHVGYRNRGVMTGLIGAAIDYAREQGAVALEAYPVEPDKPQIPDGYGFGGLLPAFLAAGFEIIGRNPTDMFGEHSVGLRPVVRYTL